MAPVLGQEKLFNHATSVGNMEVESTSEVDQFVEQAASIVDPSSETNSEGWHSKLIAMSVFGLTAGIL